MCVWLPIDNPVGIQRRPPGSISDYAPMTAEPHSAVPPMSAGMQDDNVPSPYSGRNTGQSTVYSSSGKGNIRQHHYHHWLTFLTKKTLYLLKNEHNGQKLIGGTLI